MSGSGKRVTVTREYPRKLFFEKVLLDWKAASDVKGKYVVDKALQGVRSFPIEIEGYTELRKIHGIGETIATRLDSAWEYFVEVSTDGESAEGIRLRDVKALKKGAAMPFLVNAKVAKGQPRVPYVSKEAMAAVKGTTGAVVKDKAPAAAKSTTTLSRKTPSSNFDQISGPSGVVGSIGGAGASRNVVAEVNSDSQGSETYIFYDPTRNYDGSQVILIVDNREERPGKGRAKKSISEHLTKLGVAFDLRTLSVGDFLWILRLPDGTELTLDYVVERKTWDDLKSSIRASRYHEQKLRLKKSAIRNVVLVAEGGDANDRSLEQALASTSVENQFFIQRTGNLEGTAKFLNSVSTRLTNRIKTDHFVGLSYESLQSEFRKTKTITVTDLFLRQLTVCPQLSVEKARVIVERFPTMRTLVDFYRQARDRGDNQDLILHETLPQIGKALSRSVAQFFSC
uniref:Crossover junction endonuclease MUS81 n=1 Tax=Panagrellus redivivus TaxID=6233 RepID=A0A7E4URL2_PANRE